ncbi:unnamed protein product [Nezara viridula]|uniref:Protein cereblon n=1 Tax=Nezara viridula TaxID=85310 RepID=A0A9P0E2X7_NEZVI|nr:unnamed protein product [Nezara viridula]
MDSGEDNESVESEERSSLDSFSGVLQLDVADEDLESVINVPIVDNFEMGGAIVSHNSNLNTESAEIIFDEGLPASHSYLGRDLEEIGGRLIFTELSRVVIPLLPGTYGTLLPGQTFPLTVRDHGRTTLLRKCVEGDHTFGCVSARYLSTAIINKVMFGTTAEIYEFSDDMGAVRIKAKGRQRFRLLSSKTTPSGYRTGEVLILPEIKLSHPFSALQLTSLNSFRVTNKERCRKMESFMLAWPKWVYDMYDVDKLVQRCDELTFLKQGLRKDKVENVMPKDPTELSFWIASQLDSEKRLFMLALNSPIPRLRWLLNFLRKCHQFICGTCRAVIGKQTDCFAMSIEGAQGTYVNPEGYHHDTLTLLKVENVIPISAPSTHFSWFPGYAWSIAVCRHCQKHVGWQFVATNRKLQPTKFWGLSRQSLDTRICTEENMCSLDDLPVM